MDVIVVPSPRCDTNVGWLEFKDKNSEGNVSQKVYYLPQINLSPTSNSRYRDVEDCTTYCCRNEEEICVTYYLAITKMTLQIQAEESPRFDNTFIFVGAFHTEAAYFHPLGTFLAESGGPSILNVTYLLADRRKGSSLVSITTDANEYTLCWLQQWSYFILTLFCLLQVVK